MGKNFPAIQTLKARPDLVSKTLSLIEKSFKYDATHSFEIDFAPLFHSENFHNCFILIDENDQVLAHLGARDVLIATERGTHPVTMLGGIAVDETHRGKGYFQELMRHVLNEKKDECAFFLLWSDHEQLYKKFGFYLCGTQFQTAAGGASADDYKQTSYQALSSDEKECIQKLYQNSFQKTYSTLQRQEHGWSLIEKITSAKLYIKKDGEEITSYFFRDKGQDLGGVIYEYGHAHDVKKTIHESSHYGLCWSAFPIEDNLEMQFQFMLAPGDEEKLSQFIYEYSNQLIRLRKINQMKQEAFFDFNGETLSLELEDFLRGILGPGMFEELGEVKPVFISGLDSI